MVSFTSKLFLFFTVTFFTLSYALPYGYSAANKRSEINDVASSFAARDLFDESFLSLEARDDHGSMFPERSFDDEDELYDLALRSDDETEPPFLVRDLGEDFVLETKRSFFSKIKKAVKGVAKKVGGAVKKVTGAVKGIAGKVLRPVSSALPIVEKVASTAAPLLLREGDDGY